MKRTVYFRECCLWEKQSMLTLQRLFVEHQLNVGDKSLQMSWTSKSVASSPGSNALNLCTFYRCIYF